MVPENKAERLLDLVMLLLSTARPLTAGEVRERIPGYGRQRDDTFHRMFERDKAELRDLGLPLEQHEVLGETGYRIRARDALLEDPGLTPDEQAALALAAQVWDGAGVDDDATRAVLKLAAASGHWSPAAAGWALPRVSMSAEAAALLDAIARRKRVRFRYRSAGGEERPRTVEPHGLSHRRGAWYLTGRDVDAAGVRSFKLARVAGEIRVAPGDRADFEPPPPGEIGGPRAPWEGEDAEEARIAFSPEAAWSVERRAGVRRMAQRAGGWVEMAVPFSDLESFASWVSGFADHAVALAPPALRDAVVARLRALAGGA